MQEETNYKKLVRELRKGDPFSFNEIFNKFNKKIYFLSLGYLKSKEDAEGIVQEVFMTLWRKRAELKEEHNISSYLFTITFNAIKKRFRKLSREKKYIKSYVQTLNIAEDYTNIEVDNNSFLELAKKAISKLPPQQKTIYRLINEEGLTISEISDRLNISKKTVENHLHRAKTFLKKQLMM